MRIEEGIKLDFQDILMVPQRSSLDSRSKVILERNYKFPHSPRTWTGLGIIAANMDTTGSFKMAKALAKNKMLTALHKHYSKDELVDFFTNNRDIWDNVFYTIGPNEKDLVKMSEVGTELANRFTTTVLYNEQSIRDYFPRMICLDAANAYTESFVEHLKLTRKLYPNAIIMAGNVVTGNMTEELILSGADIAKVGIGSGCFVAGTKITTNIGIVSIEDVKIGDMVLTHKNRYRKVIHKFERNELGDLLNINETICTKNHEFYVVHNDDKEKCNYFPDHEKYMKWLPAEMLDKNYNVITGGEYNILIPVKKSLVDAEITKVYDLTVEEDSSYVANGLIVHNSVCLTRVKAGVGFPQASAIEGCAYQAHGLRGNVCSDGGITCSGDVAKAFCLGADLIMVGGMFSGTDECDGEWITNDKGEKFLKFHGMSSKEAQEKWNGGLANYRASEGKEVPIPSKGTVENILNDIKGGISSACTYLGCTKIKDMPKCASFIRVNHQYNTIFGK